MIRVYLNNCAFNRPFDDQNQIRIRLASEAKLHVQEKIKQGTIESTTLHRDSMIHSQHTAILDLAFFPEAILLGIPK